MSKAPFPTLLVLALLVFALFGCSSSSSTPDSKPDSKPDTRFDLRPVDRPLAADRASEGTLTGDKTKTCSPWTVEILDSVESFDTSLALDKNGGVHVSYGDMAVNRNLKYAHRTATGAWTKFTVDSAGDLGASSEIAVDSYGIHVVYSDHTSNKLKVAFQAPSVTSWSLSFIDSSNSSLMDPSLVADGKGTLHVTYHGTDASHLKYAFRTGGAGSWFPSSIIDTHSVGASSGLAIDSSGVPHVSFFGPSDDLWYGVRPAVGSIANVSLVDNDGYTGTSNAIAVDPAGKVYISYVNATASKLKLASRAKGAASWTLTAVDTASQAWMIGNTDIAIDASGGIHVSYVDVMGSYDLRYATLAPGSSTWTLETVDSNGRNGIASSIAVDPANDVHISYYAESGAAVKYARRHPCP